MDLSDVNGAQLQLHALGIKDAPMSTYTSSPRQGCFHRQEILPQLYRTLGRVDFLGNPVSFMHKTMLAPTDQARVGPFTNFSSGIADVFYEP
ncbi:hypothetical protein BS47DRAFT_178643 [Hydnum rufescens UP504]|uniref:Uncharacterized protein n=1 Tax=Hydnum rufescens UP504 TaxID=1448309 RepID=A0A9P6ANN6_9AGAM|nr:hypothetical protein BS47DRAFT_178643 [Hydnum rufescens UP504]